MKLIAYMLTALTVVSCSPFHRHAKKTTIELRDGYYQIENTAANFRSVTYRDFDFATNRTQFRKIAGKKPEFGNILFYARTYDPPYEYFVLQDPAKPVAGTSYIVKDTLYGHSRIVVAITKEASKADVDFIFKNFSEL